MQGNDRDESTERFAEMLNRLRGWPDFRQFVREPTSGSGNPPAEDPKAGILDAGILSRSRECLSAWRTEFQSMAAPSGRASAQSGEEREDES